MSYPAPIERGRLQFSVVEKDRPRLPLLVRENLDAFVGGLRARFGRRLLSVRLFGSYARGDAHEDSDVDCLVLLDRVGREDDRAVTDLRQIGGVVISPLVMSESAFEQWKRRERSTPLAIEREALLTIAAIARTVRTPSDPSVGRAGSGPQRLRRES